MQPGSLTCCTFIPPLEHSYPPFPTPTVHPPRKALSRKKKNNKEKLIPFAKIPKPNIEQGLGVKWPAQETDMDALKAVFEDIKAKM